MNNRFRLSSCMYDRETDEEKVNPNRIVFLSVEGNLTEKEYFEGISKYRDKLGVGTKIDVVVLNRRKKDTSSAPHQVIELLEEYLRLREIGDEFLEKDIPEVLLKKYNVKFIGNYLENPEELSKREIREFETDLLKASYDINYRKYLNDYNTDFDKFAIVIDRDHHSHSETDMLDCIRHCKKNNYDCYINNPCFEFWLLLHHVNVIEKYQDKLELIRENSKVSNNHTYVSKIVSDIAHHGKNGIGFEKKYLPFVDKAIERAKKFPCEEERLIDEVGSNVWKLIEELKSFEE